MGTVMSYAMALCGGAAGGRRDPRLQRLRARSSRTGSRSFEDRPGTRAFIAHGRADPIMEIGFARRARELLEAGGLEVEYHESDVGHQIDPGDLGRGDRLARPTLG